MNKIPWTTQSLNSEEKQNSVNLERFIISRWKDFKDERGENRCTDDFICDAAQGNMAVNSDKSCLPLMGLKDYTLHTSESSNCLFSFNGMAKSQTGEKNRFEAFYFRVLLLNRAFTCHSVGQIWPFDLLEQCPETDTHMFVI